LSLMSFFEANNRAWRTVGTPSRSRFLGITPCSAEHTGRATES
jgi:hypothetical protein